MLFNGDFKRSGVDLILSKEDHQLVLQDYFKGEKRAALSSPDGAHLTGDLVNALTGQVQYAQADGSASVSKVIGHVTKLTGTAVAIRNGVSIVLNNGDNVEKGDVVQSGSNSSLGITFIDGTVFGLSSNSRMVLNDMVYDPNGSNNSSLLSLVAGTITFVAGETAKHGDMKVDTPVATMGIRGTAVLWEGQPVEIDFQIPSPAPGDPNAQSAPALTGKFQVLLEPNGQVGSYDLFDKVTGIKIATVNTAGQVVSYSLGQGVRVEAAPPMSQEQQKLIIDVFAQKFALSDPNTKTTNGPSGSATQDAQPPLKVTSAETATDKPAPAATSPVKVTITSAGGPIDSSAHIPGPPTVVAFDGALSELAGLTGDGTPDSASGSIIFADINKGDDKVSVKTHFESYKFQGGTLKDTTALLKDIAAVEVDLVLVPDGSNKNTGFVTWTYNKPDNAFDFLAAGETLTLTYVAQVDNNFLPNNETGFQRFTITITGSNDVPVIDPNAKPVLFFTGDADVDQSGYLLATDPVSHQTVPTGGTLAFQDPDLTDTHNVVSTLLTGAKWSGGGLGNIPIGPLTKFQSALHANIAADSTGTGSGVISWQLDKLPDNLADFLPENQSITLTYTIVITDSQGAKTSKDVTVTITHTSPPDVAWVHPGDGVWGTASNWETGIAPTKFDDVVIPDEKVINSTGTGLYNGLFGERSRLRLLRNP